MSVTQASFGYADNLSALFSWLPLSNRADGQNGDIEPSTVRLAKEDGTQLREEVTYDSLGGVDAVPWGEATDRFAAWFDESQTTAIVVEDETGETTAFTTPNRFSADYREMLYAKAQSLERGLRRRWGKLLHTAMVSLTASSTDDNGNPRPPVEHLRDVLGSYEAVRRALSRVLDGREWEYLCILEPHKSGYVHLHIGVFVKGPVVAEQFAPVVDAHLRNCPTAGPAAHQIIDEDGEEDTVRVRQASHPSRQDGVENLGAYLAAYMAGEYGHEATEMPEYIQRFYAVMWATGRQWFRPSNGAQELMQPPDDDEPDPHDWTFVGIAPDGDPDSEVIEVDPAQTAGVRYRRLHTQSEFDQPDPPPAD